MARVVYIGALEAAADAFHDRVRVDIPLIDLFATDDRQQAFAQLADCEVLIGHHFQFDDALLRETPRLRWIQSLTSGTDAILKLTSLGPNIVVTSTRGMHGPQMSELVFMLMLALTRNFRRMLENQTSHVWQRWPQSLLTDKTAVIVGIGAISESLALRCQAFGMQVIGVTKSARIVPGFDKIVSRTELSQVAARADYLIIVVPYSKDTDNLINAEVIGAMKASSYLINVARGEVLDEGALVAALREQRIAGAALDVFRQTPLPAASPLWDTDRLILTPLIGGMSDVYLQQSYPLVRDNLRRYLSGSIEGLSNTVER